MSTFVFHLDQDLQVYISRYNQVQTTNQKSNSSAKQKLEQTTTFTLQTLITLSRQGPFLKLAEKFQTLWQELWQTTDLKNSSQIFFLLGPKAGFTDTRIVYIWLESWRTFNQLLGRSVDLIIEQLPQTEPINTQKCLEQLIMEYLKKKENKDLQKPIPTHFGVVNLPYFGQVQIGKKKK